MKNDFYDGHKWVHAPQDIPDGIQYAIIEFGSVYIPGDERSRTNPGHGYPAHSQQTIEFILFADIAAWEAEIRKRTEERSYGHKEFVPIVFRRPHVTTTISVGVDQL